MICFNKQIKETCVTTRAWNRIRQHKTAYSNNLFSEKLLKTKSQTGRQSEPWTTGATSKQLQPNFCSVKTRYMIAYSDTPHISHSIASCSRSQRQLCRSGCNILLEKLEPNLTICACKHDRNIEQLIDE